MDSSRHWTYASISSSTSSRRIWEAIRCSSSPAGGIPSVAAPGEPLIGRERSPGVPRSPGADRDLQSHLDAPCPGRPPPPRARNPHLRARFVHGPGEPLQPRCVRAGATMCTSAAFPPSVLPRLLAQGTLIHSGRRQRRAVDETSPGSLPPEASSEKRSLRGTAHWASPSPAASLRGFDHLFDPAESGDRVREADRRQGKQADMAHFFTALALGERAARMRADGSLRLCAEGDPELDEPGRPTRRGGRPRSRLSRGPDGLNGPAGRHARSAGRRRADTPSRSPSSGWERGSVRQAGPVVAVGASSRCARVRARPAVRLGDLVAPARAAPPESGRPTPTASLACSDPNQPGRR
jgi:hypothetical protein